MAEFVSYLNGEWIPTDECKIDIFDRGLLMGDAVFDVARTYNGKPFKLERHFARMARSLKYTRMDIGMTPDEFGDIVLEAVERNQALVPDAGDLIIWWFATRGKGAWAWSAGPGTVGCRIAAVDFSRFASFFSTGTHGVITKVRSHAPGTVETKVKHYTRMNFAMAELEANDTVPGGWPILTDQEGNLTEGTINAPRTTRPSCRASPAPSCSTSPTSWASPSSKRTCSPTTSTLLTRPSCPSPAQASCP